VDAAGEFVTPTGAALCAALSTAPGPMPAMRPVAIGFGFGTRDWPDGRPNCVRVVVGEAADDAPEPGEWEIAANLDDCTPETVSILCEALFAAGALDAWTIPILMKKGRPAWTVSAIATGDRRDAVVQAFFAESTTIGLRMHRLERVKLDYRLVPVTTELGTVRVKVARDGDRVVQRSLESDDVRRLARAAGMPVRDARRLLERAVAADPSID
ncbi:MAG TPA: LarC family nickel insertion protein, partial [Myxococcota bacterium]|nr:LarC family nickel insertion protein [Myxococcota bacterium]